jgi:hypothetical protein
MVRKQRRVAAVLVAIGLVAVTGCGGGGAGETLADASRNDDRRQAPRMEYPEADADLNQAVELDFTLAEPEDGRLYSVAGGINITGYEKVDTVELDGLTYQAAPGHELVIVEWVGDPASTAYWGVGQVGSNTARFALDIDNKRSPVLPDVNDVPWSYGVNAPAQFVFSIPLTAEKAALTLSSEGIISEWSLLTGERISGPASLYVNDPLVRVDQTYRLTFPCYDDPGTLGYSGVINVVGLTPFAGAQGIRAGDDEAFLYLGLSLERDFVDACGRSRYGLGWPRTTLWDRSVRIEVNGQTYTSQPATDSMLWTVPANTTQAKIFMRPVLRWDVDETTSVEEIVWSVNFQTGSVQFA